MVRVYRNDIIHPSSISLSFIMFCQRHTSPINFGSCVREDHGYCQRTRFFFLTHVLVIIILTIVADTSSRDYCERLAKELDSVSDLPKACEAYPHVVQTLQSKEKAAANPFMGMYAGQATKARRARSDGRESHAQIQRRLTTMGQRRFSNKQN